MKARKKTGVPAKAKEPAKASERREMERPRDFPRLLPREGGKENRNFSRGELRKNARAAKALQRFPSRHGDKQRQKAPYIDRYAKKH